MASPSDAHTPQSQKAAFSLCVPREAGLVLTLCPPWRPWKDSASMAHSSSLGGAALSAAFPFLLQSSVGPPKPFLYNKDPHHLNNYHLHVLHHEPSWVSICRLRARWKKAMKMKEWEKRSVSKRAHKEKLLWESSSAPRQMCTPVPNLAHCDCLLMKIWVSSLSATITRQWGTSLWKGDGTLRSSKVSTASACEHCMRVRERNLKKMAVSAGCRRVRCILYGVVCSKLI